MSTQVAARLMVMRVLWGALIASVVLYDVVLLQVRPDHASVSHGPSSDLPPHFPEMLMALAVVLAVVSFVVPRRLFQGGLKHVDVKVTEEPGEVVGSFRESAPVRRVVTNPQEAILGAMAVFQPPFIVGMALCEAIGLFGLMLGFMGASTKVAVGFFLAAIVLMAVRYPRLPTFTRAVEVASSAKCVLS